MYPSRPLASSRRPCACTLAAVVVSLLGLLACGGDDEGGDDPAFREVQGIFSASCSGTGCHVAFGSIPGGDLDLSPGNECQALVGVASAEVPTLNRVESGNPGQSYLLCKTTPGCAALPAGALIMPLGSTDGLPAEQRDVITQWITDGVPGCPAPDARAPSFAGAASATALPSAIRVDWSAASDEDTAAGDLVYLVYEASTSSGQDFAQPTVETEPGASSIVMGGLPVSTERFYVVRVRDSTGNTDGNTNEVSAVTPAVGDQNAPTFAGVTGVETVSGSTLRATWAAASDDVSQARSLEYRVYVAESSGGQTFGSPSATSDPGAGEVLVSGLNPETDYHVVVRAVDQAGNEDSNTIEATGRTGAATSFASQVEPILVASCTNAGCHTGPRPAQGLDLRSGSGYGELVGVESTQCAGRALVTAGDPGASYLINKLRGVDICFGTQMPKGGALSAGQIQTVEDWVGEGALDN